MKRTGFKRPQYERAARQLYRLARPCSAATIDQASAPVPKAAPIRSEAYRRLVASLPCAFCGVEGFSQHAHANQGKGLALKVCDLLSFPACADRPGARGCHSQLDQGAMFGKEARRAVELEMAIRTVRYIFGAGLAPAGLTLPEWAER